MFNKNKKQISFYNFSLLSLACALTFWLSACGSGTTGDSGAVTPQGSVQLENLKVGVPEKVIEDAVLSFQLDENPISRTGGKNQYLSMTKDKKGGKFLAQCKNGYCYLLQAYYMENPVTKEEGLATMKGMLPSSAPEQTKLDDSKLTSDNHSINYYFGDKYMGELICADQNGTSVTMVNVYDLEKQRDAFNEETEKAQEPQSEDKPKNQ